MTRRHCTDAKGLVCLLASPVAYAASDAVAIVPVSDVRPSSDRLPASESRCMASDAAQGGVKGGECSELCPGRRPSDDAALLPIRVDISESARSRSSDTLSFCRFDTRQAHQLLDLEAHPDWLYKVAQLSPARL